MRTKDDIGIMCSKHLFQNPVTCKPQDSTLLDEINKRNIEAMNIPKREAIGVTPRHLWIESRILSLAKAIQRCVDENKTIPTEWVNEYNELKGITK